MVRDLGPVSLMEVFVSLTSKIFQMDDYTRMWVEHHAAGKDYMRTGFPTTNHQQVLIRSANIKEEKLSTSSKKAPPAAGYSAGPSAHPALTSTTDSISASGQEVEAKKQRHLEDGGQAQA